MPHELEYITKDALMMCDKGTAPVSFNPTYNTTVKISGCLVSTKADKIPITNIPCMGACSLMQGSSCVPVPIDWQDTYKVKVKGQQTLLYKSKLPCAKGGKIEFITSGQVKLPPEEYEKLLEESEEEDSGWGWWDTAELIPVVGNVIGMVREANKGNWGMVALNAGFLLLDVFTLGAASLATAGVKAGVKVGVKATMKAGIKAGFKTTMKEGGKVIAEKATKAGAKALTAKKALKETAEQAIEQGVKQLSKEGLKTFAKVAAKMVDDIAIKNAKVCVFACFTAGTKVATKGGYKNIENIEVGDLVWAYNEETGESDLKPVLHTMEKEVDATIQLTLADEVIETTAEHPFYTQNGWKDAGDLTTEDKIKTKNGKWQQVKASNFLYTNKKVYNFEVEKWHTYFVGSLMWLVHNTQVCLSKLFKHASEYGYDSYKALRKAVIEKAGKGSGLEVHHLFEKRLRKIFKPPKKARDMISIVLTKEEHRIFTNAWRKEIPYGTVYEKLSKEYVENVARNIYKDYPEILKALGL